MCGITALFLHDSNASCAGEIYEALNMLQHRGQDAAGIITCGKKGRLFQCKGNGMVRDVFGDSQLLSLCGSMGVGHVRYPTAGSSNISEAQPFYVNSPYGLVLAHNGNLTNAKELSTFMDTEIHRHINTESDSELLLNILANNLQQTGKFRINEQDIFSAVDNLFNQIRGGYACVAMIAGFGIVGFRDPNGIRPLVYGRRKSGEGYDHMFASESVVLESSGFRDIVDVKPGETVIISKGGAFIKGPKEGMAVRRMPCIFEYVYFARPDSIIDGISVYQSRLCMGEALASKILRSYSHLQIDVVIPVPDTSRVAALQVSHEMNLPYREGFIKNRYVGRTFIMPGQQLRKKSVRRKLNAMSLEFQNKNVLLVDDSIVRGTTSKEIIQMAREAGAKKVYFASCAPPIRFPNVYGIDMPTSRELIAFGRSEEEIAEAIGADGIIYQDLPDLITSCSKLNADVQFFETSVFDGVYITGDVNEAYLKELDSARNDSAKSKPDSAAEKTEVNGSGRGSPYAEVIGLHNSLHH